MNFESSKEYASFLDSKDPLKNCRDLFFYPNVKGIKKYNLSLWKFPWFTTKISK